MGLITYISTKSIVVLYTQDLGIQVSAVGNKLKFHTKGHGVTQNGITCQKGRTNLEVTWFDLCFEQINLDSH